MFNAPSPICLAEIFLLTWTLRGSSLSTSLCLLTQRHPAMTLPGFVAKENENAPALNTLPASRVIYRYCWMHMSFAETNFSLLRVAYLLKKEGEEGKIQVQNWNGGIHRAHPLQDLNICLIAAIPKGNRWASTERERQNAGPTCIQSCSLVFKRVWKCLMFSQACRFLYFLEQKEVRIIEVGKEL